MNKLLGKIILLPLLVFVSFYGIGRDLSPEQKDAVTNFISLVKTQDWVGLSKATSYPLGRNYPLEDITDEEDFLAKRIDLFDDSLINMIVNSDPDSSWNAVGWRGIMLMNGEIWLDDGGTLIAINYQTQQSKTILANLIEADREALPVFLQEYERPILIMDADKWIIRIDEVKGMSYRFVGWIQGNRNPNRDAVEIIYNGFLEFDGSGGNHSYTFTNDLGTFKCYINEIGEVGAPEGELVLYRDGEVYRRYPAVELKR